MFVRFAEVVVHDTDEDPALAGNSRPPVGIPSELLEFRVLTPVVLHGNAVAGIRNVESGDEIPRLVSEHPVELWFGQACSSEDQSHS